MHVLDRATDYTKTIVRGRDGCRLVDRDPVYRCLCNASRSRTRASASCNFRVLVYCNFQMLCGFFCRPVLLQQRDGESNSELQQSLAHAYASAGRMMEAQQLLDQLTQISKKRKVQAWWFASIHAALGNNDQAFEWLDKAYEERPSEMIGFRVSPEMDPLRSDARYQEMLKRMNFPQ